jgi:hypothetical protein
MSDEKLKAHEELGGVMFGLDRVLADIFHERKRAVVVKGHTRAEDDRGLPGRLALAATCYAFSAARTLRDMPLRMSVDPQGEGKLIWEHWPTTTGNFRPKDARSDLVRAAQFIVAEIERIDRKTAIYDDVHRADVHRATAMRETREVADYVDAFYQVAALVGIDTAQPISPKQVFESQVLPRLRELVERPSPLVGERQTVEAARAFISIPIDDAGGDAELQALGVVILALTSFEYGEPPRKLNFDEKRSIAAYLSRRFGVLT